MKKILIAAIAAFTLFSCGKDDSADIVAKNLTTEESKQQLEDNGIEMINEIESLQNDTSLGDLEEIISLFLGDNSNNSMMSIAKSSLINAVNVKNNKISPAKFAEIQTLTVSTPQGELLSDFNEMKGNYTWNESEDKFQLTSSNSNAIELTRTYNSKTAKLVISNFSTINHTATNNEIPTSIDIKLSIGNTPLFSHYYNANIVATTYIPTSLSHSITLGKLSFSQSMSKTGNSKANISNSLKINNKQLLGLSFAGVGNLEDIDQTGKSNKELHLLLNSVNTTIDLLNAKLDIKTTIDADHKNIGDMSTEDRNTYLNKNLAVNLTIGGNNIAKGEFYAKPYTYTDYVYHENPVISVYNKADLSIPVATYNSWTEFDNSMYKNNANYDAIESNYVLEEIEDTYSDLRLVFGDGTKSDLESYFGGSFKALIIKYNSLLNKMGL